MTLIIFFQDPAQPDKAQKEGVLNQFKCSDTQRAVDSQWLSGLR